MIDSKIFINVLIYFVLFFWGEFGFNIIFIIFMIWWFELSFLCKGLKLI